MALIRARRQACKLQDMLMRQQGRWRQTAAVVLSTRKDRAHTLTPLMCHRRQARKLQDMLTQQQGGGGGGGGGQRGSPASGLHGRVSGGGAPFQNIKGPRNHADYADAGARVVRVP